MSEPLGLLLQPIQALKFKKHVLLPLLLAALGLYWMWFFRNYAPDDAFITYRFSRNILAGLGFVYNPGEPILGTSTPLYTLLLAILGALLGPHFPLISSLVSITSLCVGAYLLFTLLQETETLAALAAALFYMTCPLLLGAIGMETLFMLALTLGALKTYLSRQMALTGLLLGFLVVTRYEMALFAALLAAHHLYQRRAAPFWLLWAIPVPLLWLFFAWGYFGTPLPLSTASKLAAPRIPFLNGLVYWLYSFVVANVWYILLIAILLLGIYALFRRPPGAAEKLILLWGGIYAGFASVLAGSFMWYYGPLIPFLAVLAGRGSQTLVDFLCKMTARLASRSLDSAGAAIQAAALVALVGVQVWTVVKQGEPGLGYIDLRSREKRLAGEWLAANAEPQASLGVFEIGVVGYYSNLYIYDLFGLVTPGLTPWLDETNDVRLEKFLEVYQPDYLLFRSRNMTNFLQRQADYRPLLKFGSQTLYEKVK